MQPSAFVVYLLIPTSNHNLKSLLYAAHQLYIFWFLHQTTTTVLSVLKITKLYIFWFLHQTTTWLSLCEGQRKLYIFWFLHQTTTYLRCVIVYTELYIFWFLHQTTTDNQYRQRKKQLYIFWFLHQTTTLRCVIVYTDSCISFDSYIKPQLQTHNVRTISVVYLLIPTSNHN